MHRRFPILRAACAALALRSVGTSAWVVSTPSSPSVVPRPSSSSALPMSRPDATNPCWQDAYDADDDCLSTVYSAAFVPGEWIEALPCGPGDDADCLPERLTRPGTSRGSGVEKVDVMEYLGLRKAAPVVDEKGEGGMGP